MFYCYKCWLQGSGSWKLGALQARRAWVPAGPRGSRPKRSQVIQHPASRTQQANPADLQLGCCCKLGATSILILGARKLHKLQLSCAKSTLVLGVDKTHQAPCFACVYKTHHVSFLYTTLRWCSVYSKCIYYAHSNCFLGVDKTIHHGVFGRIQNNFLKFFGKIFWWKYTTK